MHRTRTQARSRSVCVFAVVFTVAIFTVVLGSAATGCSTQETTPAPDAALPECNRGPFTFFCQAPAAGEPACNTASGTSPVLARLPQNTDYPVGCVVNFVGARDEQGDCQLEAVCKCVLGEVPVPAPEGGAPADAGDRDAEAGVPAEPPPQPTQVAPVWLCAP